MTAVTPGSGAMFDAIAPRYDLLNRLVSLGLDQGWRRALVRAVAPGPEVARPVLLDLATGTADVAVALGRAYPRAQVVGVDPSRRMLAVGAEKLRRAGLDGRVGLLEGDAQALPLPDGAVDGITIAFGIRNVPDRARAAAEMARVARPGAPLAILELGEPRRGLLRPFARFHVHTVVPTVGAWLSGAGEYRYLARSIAAFPAPEAFLVLLARAGWKDPRVTRLGFDAAHLYVGRA